MLGTNIDSDTVNNYLTQRNQWEYCSYFTQASNVKCYQLSYIVLTNDEVIFSVVKPHLVHIFRHLPDSER